MQFTGIDKVFFAGTNFTEFVITVAAQEGDAAGSTIDSPVIADPQKAPVLPSDQYVRTVYFVKDDAMPAGVTVKVQGSIDAQKWVDLVSFTDTGVQTITNTLPFWRLAVTLPLTPEPPYAIGVVGIAIAGS
jgi:hypothetical protein